MIALLQGKPIINGNELIILVNGVGYQVACSTKLLATAAKVEQIELHIYTHVKEEQLSLYGFETAAEKALFKLVLSVSGIGPNIALGLIGAGSDNVIEAVQQAQVSFFTAIPRVGKKLAQKIIIELSSKLGEMKKLNLGPTSSAVRDFTDALIALGYAENEIVDVTEHIDVENLKVEVAVTKALKLLKR